MRKLSETDLDLKVKIAGVEFQNPITTASGTFAARESAQFYHIGRLGAVITKGVAPEPWDGNPAPRIAETYGGMLNAIGLQNPGVDLFVENELRYLKSYDTKVIVNVVGKTIEEYCMVVDKLNETDVAMYEINISCPNVKKGGIGFGTDPEMVKEITYEVKSVAKKPIIVKLSPNVTDISAIAKAAEEGGADAISLINTLLGMRIDPYKGRPVLANSVGGLSGPAIKPIALRMVYQARKVVDIPIIGLGGISCGEDVAEFLMAGADAVSIGTAALVNPTAPVDILVQFREFMMSQGYRNIKELKDAFLG